MRRSPNRGNTPRVSLSGGRDHAANSLMVTDLRTKAEIARGCLHVDRSARGLWLGAIDLQPHRASGGRASSSDILRRDTLGMRHEIGKLLTSI